MECSTPSLPVHHQLRSLPKLMSTESVMPSNISFSVVPFSSHLQSFPASGSFQMSQLFTSVGQILELPMNIFQWIFRIDFLYDWLVWSPCSPRDSQEASPTPSSKPSILWRSAIFIVQLSHPNMTTGKTIALTRWTFVGEVMSLLFNMLSRLVIKSIVDDN